LLVAPFQLQPEKKDIVVCPLLRHSNYNRKKDTVVWPSFVAPFQLPLLCCSNYDRKKKDTVVCLLLRRSKYDRKKKQKSGKGAIVITTGKKSSSRLSGEKKNDTVVWPSFAAPFQLPLLVAPFQLRLEKKRYSRLSVVTPFQLQPKK
jgi:hypothetical protein